MSQYKDLKDVYITFVRSVLEQSAVVWHSSLTVKNRVDLERIQKAAVRVIMNKDYTTYNMGLKELKLEKLEKQREMLCLRFAKNCLKNEKMKKMFPIKKIKHKMKKRYQRKFETRKIRTNRLKKSALPYMTRLLNDEHARKQKNIEND